MTNPILASRMGMAATRAGGRALNLASICADDELSFAHDFCTSPGDAYLLREFGSAIRREDMLTDTALNMITTEGSVPGYNYWVSGHSDCKFATSMVFGAISNDANVINILKTIYGNEFAEMFIEVAKASKLKAPDLINAAAGLLVLGSVNNLAAKPSVQQHFDSGNAGIVPMMAMFKRIDRTTGKVQDFPQKTICVYSQNDDAFLQVSARHNWVSRVTAEKIVEYKPLPEVVKRHYTTFAEKIAASEPKLIIHT